MWLNLAFVLATWLGIAAAAAVDPPLAGKLVQILVVLYITMGALLLWSYRASDFFRERLPALVRHQFEWPLLVQLRRFRPPAGPAMSMLLGTLLVLHLPLLAACHIVLR